MDLLFNTVDENKQVFYETVVSEDSQDSYQSLEIDDKILIPEPGKNNSAHYYYHKNFQIYK